MAIEYLASLQEHSIAAARSSSRALVAVCAAIIVLAVTDQGNPYREAVDELNTFLGQDYREILHEYIARTDIRAEEQIDLLRDTFRESGLSVTIKGNDVLVTDTKASTILMGVDGPAYANLGRVDEELETVNNTVLVEVSNITSIVQGLSRLLVAKRLEIPRWVGSVSLAFDKSRPTTVAIISWGEGRSELGQVSGEVGSLGDSIEFELPLNWFEVLSQDANSRHLVGRSVGAWHFLPKCKDPRIWHQVNYRSATEAVTFLAGLAESPQKTLEVFGLSIPREHVSWGTALILVAFCLNFVIHLRFLTRGLSNSGNIEYPWIPLMRSTESFVYTILMLLILPYCSLVMLWNLAEDTTGAVRVISKSLIGLSAFLIALALFLLFALRKRR